MSNGEPSKISRKIFWVAVAGLVIAGFAFDLWIAPPSEEAAPAAAAASITRAAGLVELSPPAQRSAHLTVVEVSERSMEKTLLATGRVAANQNRTAHIYPLARGIVEQIPVQLGDSVDAGAPLLRYDSMELEELLHELRSVAADLERATVQAEVTKSSLSRAESLFALESISPQKH